MKVTVLPDRPQLAVAVADRIAALLRDAVAVRSEAVVAFSGGSTPAPMLRCLAERDLAWESVTVLQVDERVVPDDDERRNARMLQRELLDHVPARAVLMPVTAPDLAAAARDYDEVVRDAGGGTGSIDVVHLGLGEDGHLASLVPGDPVLRETSAGVAVTGEYQGTRRMTLTYPVLNRARAVIWEVAGAAKAAAVRALLDGDDIPAAGVAQARAELFVDQQAAPQYRS